MKCPYCGEDMELRRRETFDGELLESWLCSRCDHFIMVAKRDCGCGCD